MSTWGEEGESGEQDVYFDRIVEKETCHDRIKSMDAGKIWGCVLEGYIKYRQQQSASLT